MPTTICNAHGKVKRALATGRLVRQDTCAICKQASDNRYGNGTIAHHQDYNRPLDVEWLCRSCHIKHHRNIKPFARPRMTPKFERHLEALRLTTKGNHGINFWKEYRRIVRQIN